MKEYRATRAVRLRVIFVLGIGLAGVLYDSRPPYLASVVAIVGLLVGGFAFGAAWMFDAWDHSSLRMDAVAAQRGFRRERTVSSEGRVCPYCEACTHVEPDAHAAPGSVEECDSCGMKYRAEDRTVVEHIAEPDCELNGLTHVYENPWNYCTRCDCRNEFS
jgi:hypothetical protein